MSSKNEMEVETNIDDKNNETIPHIVFTPLFAQGHMIPMVELAFLIAKRGVLISFMTTPVNSARMKSAIDQIKKSDLPIRFIELKFNCEEVGLPEGCECLDLVTSADQARSFCNALNMLKKPLQTILEETKPRPTCIISDNMQWWTMDIAKKFNIPRLIFHSFSCFFTLCDHTMRKYEIFKDLQDDYQQLEVPNLPHKITVTKAYSSELFADIPEFEDFRENVLKAEEEADGVVVNTFKELENEYIEFYEKNFGKRVWGVGPFFMHDTILNSKVLGGRKENTEGTVIVNWLNSKEPNSVVLAVFGSLVESGSKQIIEIGNGLEASNKQFVWAIKEREMTPEVVDWMSSGFEERTKGRGLVVKGWVPQMDLLYHPAVGGFITHCGWNSTMEAISTGVPMITYPFFPDQFVNEKLIVEIFKIGISLGVKKRTTGIKEDGLRVGREEIKNAVVKMMGDSKEVEDMRINIQKFKEMAQVVVKEGGSSFESLTNLIQFAMEPLKKSA